MKRPGLPGFLLSNAQEHSNRGAMRLIEGQTPTRNSFTIETNLADSIQGLQS